MARKLSWVMVALLVFGLSLGTSPGVKAARRAKFKPIVVAKYSFENGDTEGWIMRGPGVQVASVNEAAKSGKSSLKTTDRSANWHGPSLDVNSLLKKGAVYNITGYIRLKTPPRTPSTLKLTMEEKVSGKNTAWKTVAQRDVLNNRWQKLYGKYSFKEDMNGLVLYAESSNPTEVFYLDAVTITMIAPSPFAGGAQPAGVETASVDNSLPALKDLFAAYFGIGAAVEPNQLNGAVGNLLTKHYSCIVAENVMKPVSLQPQEGRFNWGGADRIFQFAAEHGMKVRFHTLHWHQQVPQWFFIDKNGKQMIKETDPGKREANKRLLLERLETHITTVVQRYKDKVDYWDVVNEVVDPSRPDGMRNSEWYQIAGADYIELAFRTVRKVAGPKAKLYINDYSTEDPTKRDILYKLIKNWLAKGVPIDGVGHQTHINVESPSMAAIAQSIKLFAGLGLDNQITELDMSVYTDSTTVLKDIPRDVIIRQGYRYRDLFNQLKALKGMVSMVVFWGVADDHTWLSSWPINRKNLPLLFDEKYQPKPAYWGLVDPSKLPVLVQTTNVYQGSPSIDGVEETDWQSGAWVKLENGAGPDGAFKALWDNKRLYILADIKDATRNPEDMVEIFCDQNNGKTKTYQADDAHYTFKRNVKPAGEGVYKIKEYSGGYLLEASLPLDKPAQDKQVGFDIRVSDADRKSTVICWNDFSGSQDKDTSKFGILNLKPALKLAEALKGAPKIDGVIDSAWEAVKANETVSVVQGSKKTTAKVRAMWSENYLYVLAEVRDGLLNKKNTNVWEQDSIEFFVDENNGKTNFYESDDGQYRVNFDNEVSFGANGQDSRFKSAAKVVAGGYIVEAAIPFKTIKAKAGMIIGYDFQVNEADASGNRKAVVTWSDTVGNDYRDTSLFGGLLLSPEAAK